MADFKIINWFKNISIAKKLYSVIGIMALLIAIELGTLYVAVHTLSSVRAFVGAEGLWSKSQKDAVYQLQQYYQTHNEADEQAFYDFMKVPLGHHLTLLELKKENPDLDIARQGLLEGGNHPEDIDGMIELFRRFKKISYIHQSLTIWSEADSTIAGLIPIAEKLHAEINLSKSRLDLPAVSQVRLDKIMMEIEPINQKLTKLENDFSYTLGEGARWLERIIMTLLFAIAISVEITGLVLTYFVVRGISKGLKEIRNASERIAQGDLNIRAKVFSNDEIGILTNSFNTMAFELSKSLKIQKQSSQDLASKTIFIEENKKRIVDIMDALIKITRLDFSEKLAIGEKGDELDAIAVGLNTMSEELEFHLEHRRKSEEKMNDAQQLAQLGSWEWDVVHNTIAWSEELYRIYGKDKENFEANYENYLECIHPEDREYVNAIVNKAFDDHRPLNFFHRIILSNGDERILHGRGKLTIDSQNIVIGINGTAQDVTERKRDEKKLNRYTIELELKNKELAQFAYAASHDLQEPLRTISNFSKLLAKKLENSPDDDLKKYIHVITGGANRMSNRIYDLLEYTRIENDTSRSKTDCTKLVKEVLSDLSALIEESDAEIHVEELPVIISGNLTMVFQNLIINAIKFRREGIQPKLTISALEEEGQHLFKVKDNGIGIEKDYYDRIFIIFQRLHKRTEYEGTGIGLSLCKKIIEMQGGSIWVESEIGKGSTFYFTIPKKSTA